MQYATTRNEERFLTTHDGIDTGGTRVADEVVEMAARFPQLDQFSIIGHRHVTLCCPGGDQTSSARQG